MSAKPSTEGMEETTQYEFLSSKIDDYFNLIGEDKYYLGSSRAYSLRRDMTGHYASIKWINNLVNSDI